MGFVKMNCPNCGSSVELSADREFGFCQYCGTKIVQDKVIVEHRGQVNIGGIANEKTLLDRAFLFLEDRDFTRASIYFEKALDANPQCAKAYIGKLMCQLRYDKMDTLGTGYKPLDRFDYYNKAMRFADADEAAEFKAYNELTRQNYDCKLSEKKAEIGKCEERLSEARQYVETNKSKNIKMKVKRILLLIAAIFDAIVILSCLFGTFSLATDKSTLTGHRALMIALLAVFLSLFVLIVLRTLKANKAIRAYEDATFQISRILAEKTRLQSDFDKWNEAITRMVGG